ncbi:MAG: efflux RND transporter permease subunit [Alphaproteobacteria bacterium]|nr:efflux RND transporter permease subunit [Alphaproteobacteria bacterium]
MIAALVRACVERSTLVVVLWAVAAAWGVHAYRNTTIEAFPDVTNAQVTVIGQLPGMAPEEVERSLTIPLERALAAIPRTLSMRSESLFGLSLVTLTFDDDADAFVSRTLVTQRIAAADLDDAAEVSLAPDATPLGEVFQYRVTSARRDLTELRSWQEWTIARHLKQVPGVADVVSFGGFLEEIHVEVDPWELEATGLTLDDVHAALEAANLNVGGGLLAMGDQALTVRGVGMATTEDDLRQVVLRAEDGLPVLLGDVARLVRSHTPRMGSVGHDDARDVVEGFVIMRRGENPSTLLEGVHARVEALHRDVLPEDIRIEVFYDRSHLVDHTLTTVWHHLLEGFLFIGGITWLFLRTLRGTGIVVVVIPLSLLGAFAGLYALGVPANLISMGAIDFGILVDGAVVLVENVLHVLHRHPDLDERARRRAITEAAVDVATPTFFAMAILVAALSPVFTLERVEGRIFQPLALTYTLALGAALLLALTLVPALASLALRSADAHAEPRWLAAVRSRYGRLVEQAVRRRGTTLAAFGALLLAGAAVGSRLGSEFLPPLDEGDAVLFVEMPSSITLEQGQAILRDVRRRLLSFPEVAEVMSEQGRPEDGTDNEAPNMSETFVRFHAPDTWTTGRTKADLIDALRAAVETIPGVSFNFSQPIKDNIEESVSGVRGQIVLKAYAEDLDAARAVLDDAKAVVARVPGAVEVDLYRDTLSPQLQIRFRRDALAREGLTVAEVGRHLEAATLGTVATTVWRGERPVDVRLRVDAEHRADADRIAEVPVRTASGALIPLRTLADVSVQSGRAAINREEGERFLALKLNVAGRDPGGVVADAMEAVRDQVPIPEGVRLAWSGEFENQQRVMQRMQVVVPGALAVVLALLGWALGGLRPALVVLAGVPSALTGGLFALAAFGINLSVSAAVGLIALLGQVALGGLLVVGAIQARVDAGVAPPIAAVEGARERMRPVLMTALLAMLGLVPMAVGGGVGSETQQPFALVIVGGMATTLPVALLLLPALAGAGLAPQRGPKEDA